DSRLLLTTSEDRTAAIFDVSTGARLAILSGHTAGVTTAVFDSQGQRVLTGAEDGTARVWRTDSGKLVQTWSGHESGVRCVRFENDEQQIVTVTANRIER